MGAAAYKAVVKRSGTSTAFTDEPMSLVSGNQYQITDAAKRVLDRGVTPSFTEDDGIGGRVAIPASDVQSIDYLFGKVTFGRAVTAPVQVSGNYMPMQDVAGANAYNLNHGGDVLDDTDFPSAASSQTRSRTYGLRDVSVSITRWDNFDKAFTDAIANQTPVVVEIRPGGGNEIFRGWFVVESSGGSGDVAALEQEELSFQLDADPDDGKAGATKSFSWSV